MARATLLNLLIGILLALLCSLSRSAPLEFGGNPILVKRDSALYTLWNSIPATQIAKGDSALGFTIDKTVDNAWGVTFLYGCTAIMISDPNFVVVAHVQQVTGTGTTCITDSTALNAYLQNKLLPTLDLYEAGTQTRIDLMYNTCDVSSTGSGIKTIESFLTSGNLDGFSDPNNINKWGYVGGGIGVPDPNSPAGLAVVQWQKPENADTDLGTLKVFFGSTAGETPIRNDLFTKPK